MRTVDRELGNFSLRTRGAIRGPVFFPGDQRLAFGSGGDGEFTINFGADPYETFFSRKTPSPRDYFVPGSFSPDGRLLAYESNGNLQILPMDGDRKPQDFLKSRFEQDSPEFSPNGRWIAYTLGDGQGGRHDVWVRPYPGPEPAVRVSTGGGLRPRWSSDGKRVYFLSDAGKILAADVEPGQTFRASAPKVFVEDVAGIRSFVVAPDDAFYAIIPEAVVSTKRDITVVTGWFDEVRRVAGPDQR